MHLVTLRMWLCMKWHGVWLYGVHRTRRDGSSFMWHQPCQRCKYTTLVDIQKRGIKSYSFMQNHMRAQWVCWRAETALLKSDQQQQIVEPLMKGLGGRPSLQEPFLWNLSHHIFPCYWNPYQTNATPFLRSRFSQTKNNTQLNAG